MERRALIHNQGQLISAAAIAIPALDTKPCPSQIPSPASDMQGWGPPGAVAAQSWCGNPTALSNTARIPAQRGPNIHVPPLKTHKTLLDLGMHLPIQV